MTTSEGEVHQSITSVAELEFAVAYLEALLRAAPTDDYNTYLNTAAEGLLGRPDIDENHIRTALRCGYPEWRLGWIDTHPQHAPYATWDNSQELHEALEAVWDINDENLALTDTTWEHLCASHGHLPALLSWAPAVPTTQRDNLYRNAVAGLGIEYCVENCGADQLAELLEWVWNDNPELHHKGIAHALNDDYAVVAHLGNRELLWCFEHHLPRIVDEPGANDRVELLTEELGCNTSWRAATVLAQNPQTAARLDELAETHTCLVELCALYSPNWWGDTSVADICEHGDVETFTAFISELCSSEELRARHTSDWRRISAAVYQVCSNPDTPDSIIDQLADAARGVDLANTIEDAATARGGVSAATAAALCVHRDYATYERYAKLCSDTTAFARALLDATAVDVNAERAQHRQHTMLAHVMKCGHWQPELIDVLRCDVISPNRHMYRDVGDAYATRLLELLGADANTRTARLCVELFDRYPGTLEQFADTVIAANATV